MAYGACDSKDAGFPRRVTYVIGPDGAIRGVYPKVEPRSHPKAILDSLA